jgi:uncharacterized protein (DUF433 family)
MALLEGLCEASEDEGRSEDLVLPRHRTSREVLLSERLAPSDITRLLELYRSGATIQELGSEFRLGKTSVKKLLREHGGRLKDWLYTPDLVGEVVKQYQAGGTIRDLAAEFNLGTTTLKKWISQHGASRTRPGLGVG